MPRSVAACAVLATWWASAGVAVAASSMTVNSTADLPATNAASGNCVASNGLCTLRAAIQVADADFSADTITLPTGDYVITAGALPISHSMTINGAGAAATTIDAHGTSTVLDFSGGTDSVSGVTITGGGNTSAGAGIYASGAEVTLASVDLEGNHAAGNATSSGGAIEQFGGQLELLDSSVTGNSATGDPAEGGGVNVESGSTLIVATTIAGNTVDGTGASGTFGGGLDVIGGTATLRHATLIGNVATGTGPVGGNIYTQATLRIADSIIGSGESIGGPGPDCYYNGGAVTVTGRNIYSAPGNNCSFPAGTVVATSPLLGPLGDNGAPGLSAVPLLGSPAIGAASACPDGNVDERGAPAAAACDIGAIQLGADLKTSLSQSAASVAAGGSETYVASVTNAGADPAQATTLTVTPPAGAGVVFVDPSTGTCTAPAVCSLGTLPVGASASVTVVVTAPATGPLATSAGASSTVPNPIPADGQASITTSVTSAPPPSSTPPSAARAVPTITALHALGRLQGGKGGKLVATVNENVTVSVGVQRIARGRIHNGVCKLRSKRGKRCSVDVPVGAFSASLAAGTVTFALPGAVGGHKLKRGSYLLTATASDATGAHSQPDLATVTVS